MGTFNGTCYLSHLPIAHNEEVILIPLIKTLDAEENNCCYATDNYMPFGLPICGHYNEYGGLENPHTIESNLVFYRQFNYYKYIDDMAHPNSFCKMSQYEDVEDFVNEILCSHHKMYVQLPEKNGEKVRIHWIMVHKKLYDALIAEIGQRPVYGADATYRNLLSLKYNGILKMYRDSINNVVNKNAENQDAHIEKLIGELKDRIVQCIAYDIVSDLIVGGDFEHWKYFAELLLSENSEDVLNALIDRTLLTMALSIMRNGYHCVSGWGSQGNEMYLQKVVADFIIDHYHKHSSDENIRESIFFHS